MLGMIEQKFLQLPKKTLIETAERRNSSKSKNLPILGTKNSAKKNFFFSPSLSPPPKKKTLIGIGSNEKEQNSFDEFQKPIIFQDKE